MIHVDKDARVEMSGTPKQICEEIGVAIYSLLENCSRIDEEMYCATGASIVTGLGLAFALIKKKNGVEFKFPKDDDDEEDETTVDELIRSIKEDICNG